MIDTITKKAFKKDIPMVESWSYFYAKLPSKKYEVLPRMIGSDEIITKHLLYSSFKQPSYLMKQWFAFYSILINLKIWLFIALIIPLLPFKMYGDGAINFFKNGVWANNVRFFNWSNLVIMIGLILWLTIIYI